jgi:hypothetical protein
MAKVADGHARLAGDFLAATQKRELKSFSVLMSRGIEGIALAKRVRRRTSRLLA